LGGISTRTILFAVDSSNYGTFFFHYLFFIYLGLLERSRYHNALKLSQRKNTYTNAQMILTIVLIQKSVTMGRFSRVVFFFLGGWRITFIAFVLILSK
jgi:hypothetical protein